MSSTQLPGAIENVIVRGRRRLRVLWAVATAERALPAAAAVALVLAAAARFRASTWLEPGAVVVMVIAAAAVLLVAAVFPIAPLVVVRAIDNGSRSKDALATAFEIGEDDPFAGRVIERATSSIPSEMSNALPLKTTWKPWVVGAGLLAATVVLLAIANPQDDVRARQQAEAEAIAEVADEVDELAEELASDPDLTEEAERLSALADELRRSSDYESALEALDEVERELATQLDAESLAQRAASDGLAATLEVAPIAAGSSAAEQLSNAAQSLDGLTPEQADELAERLEQLAT
ncbi:MAG: hypothetical protein GY708_23095, partial [Actinomycetia bacterium]|nr:hypothetical protein [Actinomycetes bacterium]